MVGTFNQSLQCTQDVFVGFQAPSPPVFPLLGEDNIVLLDGVLDHIGGCQHLLSMLLGVGLNTMDLCHMGSPLHLSIIHL